MVGRVHEPLERPVGDAVRVGLRLGDPARAPPLSRSSPPPGTTAGAASPRKVHHEIEVPRGRGPVTVVARVSAPAPSAAPTSSRAVANSSALRRWVPRLSMVAVMPATGPVARLHESAGRHARPEREDRRGAALLDDDRDAVGQREAGHLAAGRPSSRDGRGRGMGRSPRFGRSTRADVSRGGGAALPPPSRRDELADRPGVGDEVAARDGVNVGRCQGLQPVEVRLEVPPVADHRPRAELPRLRRHAVHLEHEVRLGATLGPPSSSAVTGEAVTRSTSSRSAASSRSTVTPGRAVALT